MSDLPRTVVADPPWWPRLHQNTVGRSIGPYRAGPQRYYRLMKVPEICEMKPVTARKAHLYLWVLNQHVDWGYEVARSWGFEPIQLITWAKAGLGTGQFQCNSESFLVCRKGTPAGNAFGRTKGTWFQWRRNERVHSRKPDGFFDLVERCSPGPYLEMFARVARTSQAKKYTRQNSVALQGKCTKSAYGHGLARAGVGALAACAGGVGGVSKDAHDSSSVASALEQLGKHSGGVCGCRALAGKAGSVT